jgi:hypothetical protein
MTVVNSLLTQALRLKDPAVARSFTATWLIDDASLSLPTLVCGSTA